MSLLLAELVTILAILAVATLVWLLVRNSPVAQTLQCPVMHREVGVVFLRMGFSGEGPALRVLSCSAFSPPDRLGCRQECLKHSERAPRREEPSRL